MSTITIYVNQKGLHNFKSDNGEYVEYKYSKSTDYPIELNIPIQILEKLERRAFQETAIKGYTESSRQILHD